MAKATEAQKAQFREYHKKTYHLRREEKNKRRNAKRKATNWYALNREKQIASRMAYYYSHKEEERSKRRAESMALRLEALQRYGGRCACCGEAEPKFLAIDHLNNDGAAHRRAHGKSGAMIYRWLRKHNYPPGFQVLCHNCNSAKGRYGICPHQRGTQ
jgi:hypothetical protein